MPDATSPGTSFERWVTLAGNVIAPVTAMSALLFFFGYVSSRAQYEYFGLDVDTIGLTTQDFIMRSSQPLLVPLLVLSFLGAGAVLLQAAIRSRLSDAFSRPVPDPAVRAHRWIVRSAAVGLLILVAGMVLLFLFSLLRDWPPFNLVTPLVIALGGSIAAYAMGAARYVAGLDAATNSDQHSADSPTAPTAALGASSAPGVREVPRTRTLAALSRPAVSAFTLVVVASSIFWATATLAQWSGVGLAQYQAVHLDELPSVILDTKERLFLTSPGLKEAVLPPSLGQTFHYRYRHLRLLIQGDGRAFLVPSQWSASDSTLLVRLDPSVRLQFQFLNQPP